MSGTTTPETLAQEEMLGNDSRAHAQILEMVGDLQHADEKPKDNVLFVYKLNELTDEEDLGFIFSRFGKIKCCEVIKDRRTNKSLQYAFIEYETTEACERALQKMDNVVIDDRRIRVDFAQSVVEKYTWEKRKDGITRENNRVEHKP